MQTETPEIHPETSIQLQPHDPQFPSQHGYRGHNQLPQLLPHHEEHGDAGGSGSEWSLSPSLSQTSSEDFSGRLKPDSRETADRTNDINSFSSVREHVFRPSVRKPRIQWSDESVLQTFPEEMLFHIISHLPAADLLTVKLVSRRFYDLVNSPHAWMNAFSQFFPGPEALRTTTETQNMKTEMTDLIAEKRYFTRLTPTPSWTGEYLLRTKLLRCLNRGRPSLPFAAPSAGNPDKGTAIFTYSSRLHFATSHLHASFGQVLDKRLPRFIHGFDSNGTVSSSDKRGKFDSWGLIDRVSLFQQFSENYPGTSQWGLGPGDVTGVPNVMDLSQPHGMIYGEGTPGGNVFFLSSEQKRGHYLAPFLNISYHQLGVLKVSQEMHSVCSVWIAKSNGVPRMTNGLIGLLSGSSSGVVSAYSLGPTGKRDQRFDRGGLTARWMLSPGVPITRLVADDFYSDDRLKHRRIWAVALNALGELFYLCDRPEQAVCINDLDENLERNRELRAWQTGKSVIWHLIKPSRRAHRRSELDNIDLSSYIPEASWRGEQVNEAEVAQEMKRMESWLLKSPGDIRSEFYGWDMRRRLEVDFSGDDGRSAGEAIVTIECGLDEGQAPVITRYARCKLSSENEAPYMFVDNEESRTDTEPIDFEPSRPNAYPSRLGGPLWAFPPSSKIADFIVPTELNAPQDQITGAFVGESRSLQEWRRSRFSFGRYKGVKVTVSALDMSMYALTTVAEDVALRSTRIAGGRAPDKAAASRDADEMSPFKIPGQRARLLAAGTAAGTIFIWNIRSPMPGSSNLTNTVRPLRIIHTDSPQVSSLALTALYIVHGGSEGLVQAWDLLASTLEPVRTLSSRSTLNRRRRAVIAAQQNPNIQLHTTSIYAASAISLDPDPTVLRGVVAIGNYLRYWSFSSIAATDERSKSQKRKSKRSTRRYNLYPGETSVGTRRVGLKSFVSDELHLRELDQKDDVAEEKKYQRVASRFGLELLGPDAKDEELMAYAMLLSEEEQEKREVHAREGKLTKDASEEEVEAHKNALSAGDYEVWKFSSWRKRFEMPASESNTCTRVSKSSSPTRKDDGMDGDLTTAIRLSLEDMDRASDTSPVPSTNNIDVDDELAEAVRVSLQKDDVDEAGVWMPGPSNLWSSEDEDDLSKAIRLSLEGNVTPASSSTPCPLLHHLGYRLAEDENLEEYPALGSLQSTSRASLNRKVKGRGKRVL